VAACGDAANPTAAADAAPRQGRMLQPGQASQVEPGDFIVYRPDQYEKYGISTFTAPSGVRTARYVCPETAVRDDYYYDDPCNPNPCYGSINDAACADICYDQWGNPTYDPGCTYPEPVCYDQYGNKTYQSGCTYPSEPVCYDAYGNKTYQSGCTYPEPVCYDAYGNKTYQSGCVYPAGPEAKFNYGSSAPYDGQVNTGGVLLKQVRLISFSQSIANVASFSVDAVFKNVGAGSGYGCNNTAEAFDYASAYGTGSGGYVEVSRVAQWNGTIKWQVDGTHTFNPVSGATGGGTLYTTASFCG
jgi:hypothetical protein